MLSCKIIEYFKKIKPDHFQPINKNPLIIYPEIEGLEPIYDLNNPYIKEYEYRGANSIFHGEKYGSPNTKLVLQWYKSHVSHEQYINSQYYAKVLERIPGQQTLNGDWHNHDTPAGRKSYIVSNIDPTLFLNVPTILLPSLPRRQANENLYFPIVNKLIKHKIINTENIFRPKARQVAEVDKSFVHKSAMIPIEEDVSKEQYRWFIYINY